MNRRALHVPLLMIVAIGLSLPLGTLEATTVNGNITGTVHVKRARNNGNVVVYVEKIPGKTFAPPGNHPAMDQKKMVFIPHVLPIVVGTTVDFLNSDPVNHNIFTPSAAGDKFNLGTWPAGIVKTYTFKKPGIVTLLCNVHPEMSAYIVVTETPYFDVTNSNGAFTIRGVPPGSYSVSAWHERSKRAVTQTVTVPASGSATVNFEL